MVGGQTLGNIKLTLDLAIGESSKIESSDKGKIQGIVQKVKDLNARLQDIRREQVFQRVCGMSLLPVEIIADIRYAGTRGRVQRSVGGYECQGGKVDACATGGAGYYVCLAIVSPSGFLYQAEAYIGICLSPDGGFIFYTVCIKGYITENDKCLGSFLPNAS